MCRGRGHGVALVEGMEGLALMGVRRAGIMVGESVCSWGGGGSFGMMKHCILHL